MTEVAHGLSETRPDDDLAATVRPRPLSLAIPALAFLVLASAGMLLEVEPFISFFYMSAWYPTLILLDSAVAARTGRYYLITRPRFALSLLGWSAVLWFFFEVINFRVQNWYYVSLPPDLPVRWLGIAIAFATVLPAIFLAERLLEGGGRGGRGAFVADRWPTFKVGRGLLRGLFVAGVAFVVLSLLWPRIFFPLIWGALTLLLEPWNYSRDPDRSLVGDLAAGRPGRFLRLLVGGAFIGFIWELYNIEARAKWIYTVPGFEDFKLFEMPLLGFVGFPVLALDCFVVYQSLVLAGVAVPPELGLNRRIPPRRVLGAAVAAVVFSLVALVGMDRWNTDSTVPRLDDLWLAEPAAIERLAAARYDDLFQLAESSPAEIAKTAGVTPALAQSWIDAAQLTTLRGLGTRNARLLWEIGITSVDELARSDAEQIGAQIRAIAVRPRSATPPKVRVWVEAARRASTAG